MPVSSLKNAENYSLPTDRKQSLYVKRKLVRANVVLGMGTPSHLCGCELCGHCAALWYLALLEMNN